MIIKSFTAETVAGALKLIKGELGGAAVILKTRVSNPTEFTLTGSRVEVTACVDEGSLPARKAKKIAQHNSEEKKSPLKSKTLNASTRKSSAKNSTPSDFVAKLEKKLDTILNSHNATESVCNLDPRVKPIYLNLLDADIPVEIARQLIKVIEGRLSFEEEVEKIGWQVLREELDTCVVPDVRIEPGMKVAFAGPSGAGKTSALAKMAAFLSIQKGMKVALASLDNMKVAAYEEIGGYAEILEVPLDISGAPEKRHQKDTVLLIDTPSIMIQDSLRSPLTEKIRELRPDIIFLVFSVSARSRDLVDSIIQFEELRPTYLIASHLDESRRWGGVLTMAKYLDIPLAFIAASPGGVGMLETAESTAIARRILKIRETADEK